METELLFRILLPSLILAFIAHRGYYTHRFRNVQTVSQAASPEPWSGRLAALAGTIGLVGVVVYALSPAALQWARISFPWWVRLIGLAIALAGFTLLQTAQMAIGANWSDAPRMLTDQRLITTGPYGFARHPIYTAFICILGSTLLISANWLIGVSWIAMTVLEVRARIRMEEALMLTNFGNQYRAYMRTTGRFLPRWPTGA